MTATRKNAPEARVFVIDKAEEYLVPYEFGGVHQLPGPELFNPKDIDLNQYGQLPRGIMAKPRSCKDIYIGAIKTSHGRPNGVWQRVEISRTGKTLRKRPARGSVHDNVCGHG